MSAYIRLHNLSLDVPVFLPQESRASNWRGLLAGAAFARSRRGLARLLDGLTFDVGEGDRVAILGRNGAGKSTLLRVLNGVYQPTQGSIQVSGTRQALLNIALGFNGEATVKENVLLRGSAMGVSAAYLMEQVDEILEFAGLVEKTNHLLRTLSSGQRMRLGFAISTAVQHDIILMDEWVGTGDADFMAKAKDRLLSRMGGSKIVMLASHSTGLLRDVCNKGIVLERGRLLFDGDIVSALKFYHEQLAAQRDIQAPQLSAAEEPVARAQIFGCAEKIVVHADGLVEIEGWFADAEGSVPDSLALLIDGEQYPAESIERTRRADVMRHFGLAHDGYGFRARVPCPPGTALVDARVYAGQAGRCDAILRLAANAAAQLTVGVAVS